VLCSYVKIVIVDKRGGYFGSLEAFKEMVLLPVEIRICFCVKKKRSAHAIRLTRSR
jgi:hypothetical protein